MTHPNTAAPSNEVKLKENIRKKPETMTRIFFEKFFKNRLAVVGGIILTVIILMAVFAPFIAPYSPESQSLLNKLKPPSAQNLMGTDKFGRDIFTRVLYGARVSLLVGFASVIGAITIGTVVGALAGYFRGIVDAVLMRAVDVVLSIPDIFLLITLVTIFQPGMDKLILIFSLTGWTTTARLVRGEFLSLRSREFVLAAKTIGTKNHKIIFSHILPNCIGPIIVSATLKVGSVILAESTLSYLGFGIQPPIASWGNMLQDAQNFTLMIQAWWYPLFPGLFILMTVLCFNFVGDGLRDALDPKNIK
ncbi:MULTISPECIES: oligopeptide ABC transporter permease [Bacillus]|uniref:oligopeptide ABC transporter permease n=1 Tax=Bacillus TaxID=1386 RepID=UPI000617F367|nr:MULTISPECIES: oligopeptide ABC transporter permease [Bacillus]MUG00883.1 ABC transporter permease [Bacillus tequilensis]ARV98115.1 Oligopeptide transport system permease protein AppC [Bacillus subtilis subsp. subtilis]ARW02194.1 Oligopeptide transport system permease protein AppC [Bacillus subtilis subsp. subtilis]ASB56599.1 Oligopeptide transport system permease protein AppC [Bacillus subtilis subsp. subtilis]KKB92929.1 peptide ABC transporter permease [Bacillus sp. CMAA 1185]